MSIDLQTNVGDVVSAQIGGIEVFETFGIDYCCGGQSTLMAACEAAGADPAEVVAALVRSDAAAADAGTADTTDWRTATLTELTNHIVATHHEFMKRELPRVDDLMAKVLNAHGGNHAELAEVAGVYAALRAEIADHLKKEEQMLFPMIQEMEITREAGGSHCGSVNNPIGVMEHEHDNAGEALRRLRELTSDYTTPADGCPTYQALMAGMAAMERDLHEHIHKENNILHPRAAALESSLLGAAADRS